MFRAISLAATLVTMTGGALATCDDSAEPVRPAQTIYVPEDYDVPFDARSGDTVIVIMYPDGSPVDRCDHMGGEPIYNPYTLIYTCEGVDF